MGLILGIVGGVVAICIMGALIVKFRKEPRSKKYETPNKD